MSLFFSTLEDLILLSSICCAMDPIEKEEKKRTSLVVDYCDPGSSQVFFSCWEVDENQMGTNYENREGDQPGESYSSHWIKLLE